MCEMCFTGDFFPVAKLLILS